MLTVRNTTFIDITQHSEEFCMRFYASFDGSISKQGNVLICIGAAS